MTPRNISTNRLAIALTVVSLPVVAAPIDEKTEHLGLRLGSLRSELKQEVRNDDGQAGYEFRFVKLPEGMQTPSLRAVPLRLPKGATFGGYRIYRITGYYLSDYLCSIRFEFESYFTGNEVRDDESRRLVEAVADGLREKYGPPSYLPAGQTDYRKMAVWEGDDIVCYFANVPAAPMGGRFTDVGVTLESKAAFKKAEQEAVRRFEERQRRIQQKAQDIQSDL